MGNVFVMPSRCTTQSALHIFCEFRLIASEHDQRCHQCNRVQTQKKTERGCRKRCSFDECRPGETDEVSKWIDRNNIAGEASAHVGRCVKDGRNEKQHS